MSIKEACRVRYSPAGSHFGIFSFFTLRIMDFVVVIRSLQRTFSFVMLCAES